MAERDAGDRTRVETLDGLRGVAAFIVVITHVLVASMHVLEDSLRLQRDVRFPDVEWWLIKSPLQIVWSGQAAVLTFFVLSGYVLALPYVRGRPFSARSYYPKRLLRLYPPVWGALLLAFLLHLAYERVPSGAGTDWLNAHAMDPTRGEAARGAFLLDGTVGAGLLTVIWTLEWEVLFSLLLPLYLLVARRASSPAAAAALAFAAVVAMLFAQTGHMAMLPVFLLGTLLAFQRRLIARTARLLAAHRALRIAAPVPVLLLLTVGWWIPASIEVAHTSVAVGAALAVLLAVSHGGAGRALRTRPVQWTGRRSFSLYLVHEPVLVTIAFALGSALSPLLLLVLAVPAALLVSDVFFRLVERPSHELSRRAGTAFSR